MAKRKYEDLVNETAKKYGVNPAIAQAVVDSESSRNPLAVSPKGAQGLMQIMPGTAKELGLKDPFDPAQNIDAGVRYLDQMIKEFGPKKGVAAYNAGPGNVRKFGDIPDFPETQNYVKNVFSKAKDYGYQDPIEKNLGEVTTTLPVSDGKEAPKESP